MTWTYTIPTDKRKLAIAEIVIYFLILIIQFPVRYIQEWRYWHHDKNQSWARCIFYSWYSMIGLLSQLRIAGSAMVLASSHPSKPMLIAETSLQSVGLSPLVFEVSLVLLRCGQSGEFGPGNSKHPKKTRFALHAFRFPVIIGIVLTIVGKNIGIHAMAVAGSILLVIAFAFAGGLASWLAVKSRSTLSVTGHRGVCLVLLALPFLFIRVVYFILQAYGGPKYEPATGETGILVGMGLLMEIIALAVLLGARAVIEPISSDGSKRVVGYDDPESADI
ncbi:hypothetical protein N7474_010042 [Penicillium riverlandense]|uniref:uncharacterized protein n=1 Tax=Penicillium riverlandense TaxID=1903569 RepID=UPI0025481128|nr:uncharacterized protein N7474_010042 [Penicillium riverlandense]KAJ5808773.1 hypothetical protein N7474_010042 [Penicillium riverlandense]